MASTPAKAAPSNPRLARVLREAGWILLLAAGVYLALALGSYSKGDPGPFFSGTGAPVANRAGAVGAWLAEREAMWGAIEDAELHGLPLAGALVDPFDVDTMNRSLVPQGLVYGAGMAASLASRSAVTRRNALTFSVTTSVPTSSPVRAEPRTTTCRAIPRSASAAAPGMSARASASRTANAKRLPASAWTGHSSMGSTVREPRL